MITAVIVDDEPSARKTLKTTLDLYCPEITVVGMAGSRHEAVTLIAETRPNIAFLDIQMPDGSGFDVARECPYKGAKLIFVSAHLDRGVETYQYKALFYLSKPLRITDMQDAMAKYHELVALEALRQNPPPAIVEPPVSKPDLPQQLMVPDATGIRLFPFDEILYVKAERNYCELHLQGEKKVVLSKTVREIATLLPTPQFLRVHRSYILNASFIAKVSRSERHPIELRDGTVIPVSKEYIAVIRQIFFGPSGEVG